MKRPRDARCLACLEASVVALTKMDDSKGHNIFGQNTKSKYFIHLYKIPNQVAQNQVKVATDGSFCADTTFV